MFKTNFSVLIHGEFQNLYKLFFPIYLNRDYFTFNHDAKIASWVMNTHSEAIQSYDGTEQKGIYDQYSEFQLSQHPGII